MGFQTYDLVLYHLFNYMVNWKRVSEYLLYGLGAGLGLFIIYAAFKQDLSLC